METFSALLALCAGNSTVTGEFRSQRPVTWSFDVFIICAWTNGWVYNRDVGDLRRHRAHYDVTVIWHPPSDHQEHISNRFLFRHLNLSPANIGHFFQAPMYWMSPNPQYGMAMYTCMGFVAHVYLYALLEQWQRMQYWTTIDISQSMENLCKRECFARIQYRATKKGILHNESVCLKSLWDKTKPSLFERSAKFNQS